MGESSSIEHLLAGKPKEQAGISILERIESLQRISEKEKEEFCTQLSVLLMSRVSLQRSLEILAMQGSSRKLKRVINDLNKEIQKGGTFSRAIAQHEDVFDPVFVVTAEIGQESGYLGEVLAHYGQYLEKIGALKRKVVQALTYPALVISVAVGAVLFLLFFIVPTFAEMFKNFQVELPQSTVFVLGISEFLTSKGIYSVFSFLLVFVVGYKWQQSDSNKEKLKDWVLTIPFAGRIVSYNHISRFCRTLGTLLQAHVTLVDALGVTRRIASTTKVRDEVGLILKSVKQGGAIAEQLQRSRVFPPMVAQMIAVGEETSEIDVMLLKVAEFYEHELDAKIESLSTLLEPLLIILLGFIVGGILVSMYLPMFDLVNLVGATR